MRDLSSPSQTFGNLKVLKKCYIPSNKWSSYDVRYECLCLKCKKTIVTLEKYLLDGSMIDCGKCVENIKRTEEFYKQEQENEKMDQLEVRKQEIEKMKGQFALVLPENVSEQKFIRILQSAITTNRHLLNANKTSLLAAAMEAAKMGLLPDGKESAIIPFKGQCQFVPMVRGLLNKLYENPRIIAVGSSLIHERDKFEVRTTDEGENFSHIHGSLNGRGEKIGAYAFARMKGNWTALEVMNKEDIEKIKATRPQGSPWTGEFEGEMWRKSVLKRLIKRLPINTVVFYDEKEELEASQAEGEGDFSAGARELETTADPSEIYGDNYEQEDRDIQ